MTKEQLVALWFDRVKGEVKDEMQRAVSIHGLPTDSPARGACRLIEEVGEVATEAADATRLGNSFNASIEHLSRMCTELTQVAAYAILLRCRMEEHIKELKHGKGDQWDRANQY